MIIDSHTHVDAAGRWIDPPEALLPLLDEAGIARAVIMTYRDAPGRDGLAPLEYIRDCCRRYPERLIGYARLNPRLGQETLDALDLALGQWGMKGVKLHPVSYVEHPGSANTLAVIRAASRYNAPVLFHCGDEEFTMPLQIAAAAAAVPEATIILGHMGGYFHVEDAIRVAERYPNIYLETSAMPYPAMIGRAVAAVGAQRVLYASDGPGCDPALEVAKVRRAGLSEAQLQLLFHANIQRLLDGVRSLPGGG